MKAKETVAVFARNAPSPRESLANRTGRFDELHGILPSTATPGEPLSLTVQAWDQCERLLADFDGTVAADATDPDATYPRTVSFGTAADGVVRTEDVQFETPGVQYLTLTTERGQQFVSNPVRVAPRAISVDVAGTAPVANVGVVKNNEVWRAIDGADDPDADLDTDTVSGEWTDEEPLSGTAWVGPIWVESP
ncbi:MAG: hypothetical protein ABEJ78_11150 [Haloferacaceae archaeon]